MEEDLTSNDTIGSIDIVLADISSRGALHRAWFDVRETKGGPISGSVLIGFSFTGGLTAISQAGVALSNPNGLALATRSTVSQPIALSVKPPPPVSSTGKSSGSNVNPSTVKIEGFHDLKYYQIVKFIAHYCHLCFSNPFFLFTLY